MRVPRPFLLMALCATMMVAQGVVGGENMTPVAATAGATLKIVGPTEPVEPKEEVQLSIKGLTLEEIKAAREADPPEFDLTVWPLKGVIIDADYNWFTGALELEFEAKNPGKYLVKMHLLRDGKLEIAPFVITVGGTPPDPGPGPDPPEPDPPTPGPRQIAFMVENTTLQDLPRPQQTLLASKVFREELAQQGHVILGFLDKDATDGSEEIPDKYKQWYKAAKGKPVPLLMIAPKDGGTIVTHPLPADIEAFWNLMGGKQ